MRSGHADHGGRRPRRLRAGGRVLRRRHDDDDAQDPQCGPGRSGLDALLEPGTAAGRPSKGTPADEVESVTMTETPTHTIGSAGRLTILSRDDLERLDAAALEVLADTGVAIPSERARAALVAQGATADGACVTLPPGAGAPARGPGAGAHDPRRPRRRAHRHRRAVADHHRRLLRRDLRPGHGREARHHGRGRRDDQPRGRRAPRGRLLLAGGECAGPPGGGARPARALPGDREHGQARADRDRRRAGARRGGRARWRWR